jgi:hypothetical protein
MADQSKMFAVASIGIGGILAWSALNNKSILSTTQNLIQGKKPVPGPGTNSSTTPVTAVTIPSVGSGSLGTGATQNLLYVAEFMVANGYSKAAAAGIASCVNGESGGNPEAQGTGGRGLIGWTPPSKLPDSAFTGNAAADLPAQCAEILNYNNEQGAGLIAMLNSQTSPVSAAMFYSLHFERPLIPYSDVSPTVATKIYDLLQSGGSSSTPTG